MTKVTFLGFFTEMPCEEKRIPEVIFILAVAR